eukprot:Gb_41743 [translate_table: standard]
MKKPHVDMISLACPAPSTTTLISPSTFGPSTTIVASTLPCLPLVKDEVGEIVTVRCHWHHSQVPPITTMVPKPPAPPSVFLEFVATIDEVIEIDPATAIFRKELTLLKPPSIIFPHQSRVISTSLGNTKRSQLKIAKLSFCSTIAVFPAGLSIIVIPLRPRLCPLRADVKADRLRTRTRIASTAADSR